MAAISESEAGEKWCPLKRVPLHNGAIGNSGIQSDTTCLGSQCMMWRWESFPQKTDMIGYCGLAPRHTL